MAQIALDPDLVGSELILFLFRHEAGNLFVEELVPALAVDRKIFWEAEDWLRDSAALHSAALEISVHREEERLRADGVNFHAELDADVRIFRWDDRFESADSDFEFGDDLADSDSEFGFLNAGNLSDYLDGSDGPDYRDYLDDVDVE